MTTSRQIAAERRPRRVARGNRAGQDDARDPWPALQELTARVDELESALERVQTTQATQFVQVMKFTVLRHASVLGLFVEQSGAPHRLKEQGRQMIDEVVPKIVQAESLDEVRELDVALQEQVRRVVAAFHLA
ncbi:MAG: hypothetical protein V3V35_07845 [Dehalococcoidia bacterium]